MKKVKIVLYISIILASIYAGYAYSQQQARVTYQREMDKAVEQTAAEYEVQIQEKELSLEETIVNLKEEVVARIIREESGSGHKEGELLYAHDPQKAKRGTCARIGGKRDINCDSWGILMFKLPTIIFYYKTLYGQEISEKEALLIAIDDEKAKELASDIIFEVEGGVWNWSVAYNDPEYYAHIIPFVRSLEEKLSK